MTHNLLEDITIVDFSARLPGPLATAVLVSLGANIIKLENTDIGGDPFNNPEYISHAPYFQDWYKNLNRDKNIISLSFKNESDKISKLIESADLLLINESRFLSEYIKKFNLKKKPILSLSAGIGEFKFLHDLNAMALTSTFKDHLKDTDHPPFLPFAGMAFGQYLATTALALIIKQTKSSESVEKTIYLKDTTEFIFDLLNSDKHLANDRFLHNGAFACYNTYRLNDGNIACLAAVEEKFWQSFIELFKLDLNMDDRFDLSGNVQNKLKKLFSNYNSSEIKEKIADKELCLTISSW